MGHYHIRFMGEPWCDFTACQAGLELAIQAGGVCCGHSTLRGARTAAASINRLPGRAGSAQVRPGRCPNDSDPA